MISGQMAEGDLSVELGCGCGNFKEFRPTVLATDTFVTPWCDQVVDAGKQPFGDRTVANLILIDVLHHIPCPGEFFAEAERVLVEGGRVLVFDQLITPWSGFVYGRFHHEPFDLDADLLNAPQPVSAKDYANTATATILFRRQYDEFTRRYPSLVRVHDQVCSCLAYPLTGGFQKFCLIPAWAVGALDSIENFLISRLGMEFLGMRLLTVLEKGSL